MIEACCEEMREELGRSCPDHPDRMACPDTLVAEIEDDGSNRLVGLVIHDGGRSIIGISYCPWCGTWLYEQRRRTRT